MRAEREGDAEIIAALVRRAYADVPHSDQGEHRMIARLRASAAFVPDLSLIAEIEGEAVGHVLLTRAKIGNTPTLALAPLSVVPEYQGRGVGARLVREAHARAAALGFESVVLIGLPDYYPRFGYAPLADHPITVPFAVPPRNCMILALRPGALDGVAGTVVHAPEWMGS